MHPGYIRGSTSILDACSPKFEYYLDGLKFSSRELDARRVHLAKLVSWIKWRARRPFLTKSCTLYLDGLKLSTRVLDTHRSHAANLDMRINWRARHLSVITCTTYCGSTRESWPYFQKLKYRKEIKQRRIQLRTKNGGSRKTLTKKGDYDPTANGDLMARD